MFLWLHLHILFRRWGVANLPGRGCKWKIDDKLKIWIIGMVTKSPRSSSKEIKGELRGQVILVSDRTTCQCLRQSRLCGRQLMMRPLLKENHKKARLEFATVYIDQPQSFLENVLWTDKIGAFRQGTSALNSDKKNKHIKKITLSLLWNMQEAWLCSGATLLLLAQGVLNLCWVQSNLKTIKAFWNETCYPVSESLVSVILDGTCNISLVCFLKSFRWMTKIGQQTVTPHSSKVSICLGLC